MAELIASPVLTYGLEQEAHFRAGKIKLENTGVSYILESKEEQIGIDLQVMGLFNVYNSLGLPPSAAGQGVSLDRIKRGLESVPGVPGRFQRIPNRVGLNVVVDYAHTPTAWRTYSAPARPLVLNGRIIVVFGAGGDRDKGKRPPNGCRGS